MNAFKLLSTSCLAFGLLINASGCALECAENEETSGTTCIAKSLKVVTASEPKVTRVNYRSGGSLDVKTVNGDIRVVQGSEDAFVVETTPRTAKAHDVPAEEFTATLESLNERSTATGDSSGNAVVRAPGKGYDAVSVVVRLPLGFNGKITLNQGNGSTEVREVGDATALDIFSDNGACDIAGGSKVVSARVHCENGGTSVVGIRDSVDIVAGNGDLYVELDEASAGGGTITAEFGDIELRLPSSGDFSVQATARDLVDFGAPPSSCQVSEAAANSKTLSCNVGGPNYRVSADGLGGQVLVRY